MPDYTKFSMALRAFQLVPSNGNGQPPSPAGRPAWNEKPRTMPADSLLFGLADDGKPLMLSLADPHPGPVLVIADEGCGKTHFLKTVLIAAQRLRCPAGAKFSVLTSYPEDFARVKSLDNLRGVYAAYEPAAGEMLYKLACRIQSGKSPNPLLLLVDGLDALYQLDQASLDNLAYILANGPEARIWPIVTANTSMVLDLPDWLECFRTRIYGRVNDQYALKKLTHLAEPPFAGLLPGTQFCMREKSRWLKFWLPTVSE